MREQPVLVLQRLAAAVQQRHQIVISTVTYAEMRYGQIGKKASPKHARLVDEFVRRVDQVLAWDAAAVDATIIIKQQLTAQGQVIGTNDMAIAGHAIAARCILVTNNTREFGRVPNLNYEDWAVPT